MGRAGRNAVTATGSPKSRPSWPGQGSCSSKPLLVRSPAWRGRSCGASLGWTNRPAEATRSAAGSPLPTCGHRAVRVGMDCPRPGDSTGRRQRGVPPSDGPTPPCPRRRTTALSALGRSLRCDGNRRGTCCAPPARLPPRSRTRHSYAVRRDPCAARRRPGGRDRRRSTKRTASTRRSRREASGDKDTRAPSSATAAPTRSSSSGSPTVDSRD